MFASRTVIEHLLRGAIGMVALVAAVIVAPAAPLASLALVPLALVALRGCPTCWTIGLIETVTARARSRAGASSCVDGRCALPAGKNTRTSSWSAL